MKVTSKRNTSFPKHNWGINEGQTRELPKEKEAQERILADDNIETVNDKSKEEHKN